MAVIICSRCSICGLMCSPPRAGAPLGRRPPIFSSRRQVGPAQCPTDAADQGTDTNVWIIGRTKTDGPPDYEAVHKIQAGYKITPLSSWGKTPEPVTGKVDPSVDMKTPPKIQVDTMSADKYFAYAAKLLKEHPPHITDEPIIARMKRIGIEAGRASIWPNSIRL